MKTINKPSNIPTQKHELFTIKIYNKKLAMKSKINFLLYKAYEITPNSISSKGDYLLNTKENYNFFNALHTGDYRASKISRLIRVRIDLFNLGYTK